MAAIEIWRNGMSPEVTIPTEKLSRRENRATTTAFPGFGRVFLVGSSDG
jgi:hypothetical protein